MNASTRRLRICPTLVMDEDAMSEGVGVLERALEDLPELDEI